MADCITGEMFVSGSSPDGDSCAAHGAEGIHQLAGYSKQTLSDGRLTGQQISLSLHFSVLSLLSLLWDF